MTVTLESLRGRVMDLDAHEMISVPRWSEYFGPVGEEVRRPLDKMLQIAAGPERGKQNLFVDVEDGMEISAETVWNEKGPAAPSAMNLRRRPEVMAIMGVRRQLIFPGFGFNALKLATGCVLEPDDVSRPRDGRGVLKPRSAGSGEMAVGMAGVAAHNKWAAELTTSNPDSLRMVGIVTTNTTVETMVKECEGLIAAGIRAVWIPSGDPPAGISPADTALDPFYALLAESDTALVLHTGTGTNFPKTRVWGQVPQFMFIQSDAAELPQDPYNLSRFHVAEENFVTVLVIGGVFERHPDLRFGAIEVGASWIGPLAERMDFWVDNHRALWEGHKDLSMRPSEYLARNVRVTPFSAEPVEVWIERYPAIEDVYCFSTDYPHVEGGRQSLRRLHKRITPLGDAIVEKFFCTNGRWLLPD
jgi:predicted TIM-barrel fold metal-dependent hydrolase